MSNRAVLNEKELAERWGVSPKTLQKWRSERRGPAYLRLSWRFVCYPIEDVMAFERQQKRLPAIPVTEQAASDVLAFAGTSHFISGGEASQLTNLPISYFTNSAVRKQLGIPHYYVGRSVRFRLDELRDWEMANARKAFNIPEEGSIPAPAQKYSLRDALERLARTGAL